MNAAAPQKDAHRDELNALLNGRPIVLVGMMGAGKTTVGRRLAARLGRHFVDSDEEVERAAGMSIEDIFTTHGEADFELLFQRVQRRSNRPLLKTPNPRQTLMDLIERRYPTYAEADVTVVSTDVPQDQVAGEVIEALLTHLRGLQ